MSDTALPSAPPTWGRAFTDLMRVTFFGQPKAGWHQLHTRHLIIGLIATWIVGIGRWWDDPRSLSVLQRAGLGSLLYVFVLAAVVCVLIYLTTHKPLHYMDILTMITMTAPPAILYAIPIEIWVDDITAVRLNLALLTVVALWRVALLIVFTTRYHQTKWFDVATTQIIYLSMIVFFISCSGSMSIVDIMGGIRDQDERTKILASYYEGAILTCIIAFPTCLLLRIGSAIVSGFKKSRSEK